MKNLILLILILTTYFSLPLYADNNWLHIKDTFYKNFQKAICFDSLNYGALGLAINGVTKFYLTADGGINWQQTLTDDICFLEPEIRRGNLYPIDISRTIDGFVYIACDTGYFIYSTDSCSTWQRFKSSIDSNFKFFDMYDSKIGIAATEHTLFISEDGCSTFIEIPINIVNAIISRIWNIKILDENHIFIIAESYSLKSNVLIKSSNQGSTWEMISFGKIETGRLFNIGLEHIWLAAPISIYSQGKKTTEDFIYYSNDHGNTWILQYSNQKDNDGFITSLYFYDEFNGIATGWYGLIYMTFDGGKTWQQSFHRQYYLNENLFACLRISQDKAVVFSDKGHIYKYKLNEMSINYLHQEEIFINYLTQSDYLEINFNEIDIRTSKNLENFKIYNILGECMVNQSIPTSNGKQYIDVSKLSAGLYFVIIGNRVEKFVKM